MKDLQLAFFKSGGPNLDIPQDHAFFAKTFEFAAKNNVKFALSGSNFATESVLPESWGYQALDLRHIMSIHKRFGQRKLQTYPTVSFFQYYIEFPFIRRMKILKPLNLVSYDKNKAIDILQSEYGWRNYGGKHHESRFTKLFQAHLLPTRFGFDKRRAHLSSQILAGAITRNDAISDLSSSPYNEADLAQDVEFVAKKLGVACDEFISFLNLEKKTHKDYPSNSWLFELKDKIKIRSNFAK